MKPRFGGIGGPTLAVCRVPLCKPWRPCRWGDKLKQQMDWLKFWRDGEDGFSYCSCCHDDDEEEEEL